MKEQIFFVYTDETTISLIWAIMFLNILEEIIVNKNINKNGVILSLIKNYELFLVSYAAIHSSEIIAANN